MTALLGIGLLMTNVSTIRSPSRLHNRVLARRQKTRRAEPVLDGDPRGDTAFVLRHPEPLGPLHLRGRQQQGSGAGFRASTSTR